METLKTGMQEVDPLIDEIRAIREDLSEQTGNDLTKLCDYLHSIEKQHSDRLVNVSGEDKTSLNITLGMP